MTTLYLPRYTRGAVPDARDLAILIAHDLDLPVSWESKKHAVVDHNRGVLVVDLLDADPKRAAATCHEFLDHHHIAWEIRS